ncbi:polysaccharide pyruvyl transferase CsaB [Gloeocapsa sp. PCC 73106]|uniref:polysaccharide pyruvyl transferase CsaB n=1 Tax=Gloeocapsa sp. PCC 73106 TaxID=102232 RepID=UPI0002AC8844|nr:polysaccharide pyruvyl transferase CsaB [Gloeocapsa sp. PCC 73106]ELR97248.1 polysaccharide pyruvyl transferase CsaB [Gloeocapsa sp. PCC 73106]
MDKLKAIVSGYYGKGNAGDEALLLSLLQMLPPSITPIVLSANPTATRDSYGVETVPRRSLFPLLKSFRESDMFIWGGGSLIQDVTSFASPFYYLSLMGYAQKLGLATFAWAQGIGPIKAKLTQRLTASVLQRCKGLSVRDCASAKLLEAWGISCILAPDPVWTLSAQPVKQVWEIRAPRVAVNLRPSAQLTPERLEHLTRALIDFQKATNVSLLFLPFQSDQDLPLAQRVATQLPGAYQILSLQDPRALKGVFRGVEMLIGMRYHSLVMAASEGCRCFAISYDPKVKQLQQELNLPGWDLTELPDDPNLISTVWLKEYTNGDALELTQIQSLIDRAWLHQQIFSIQQGACL